MPTYDFECSVCGDREDNVIFKISEYDEMSFKNKPCHREGCQGIYEHTFEKTGGFTFKGGAPTPKFFPG